MKIFWNENDVASYLMGTIVLYKGLPHSITGQTGRTIEITRVDLDKRFDVQKSDPELDVGTVPLGYVNYNRRVYYLQRIPRRQWRQGIRPENLECYVDDQKASSTRNIRPILSSSSFVKAIKGDYPTFKRVVKDPEAPQFVALSRDVMVKGVGKGSWEIFHQKELAGQATSRGKVTLIEGPCKWVLEDELSKINWKV